MKKLLLAFLFLTVINGIVFIFRDAFQYTKYSAYEELYAPCGEDCKAKWDDVLLPYSAASLAEAKGLLQPLRLDTGTTLSKVIAISHHLYNRFGKQAGYPREIIHQAGPLEQYKILSADTAQKVFCGTYAQMFSFFCGAAGIVCRILEIYRPGDHHVLNECYLPEQKQWVMVDVTSNTAAVSVNDRLANSQDFVQALNKPASVAVLVAESKTWQPLDQFSFRNQMRSYYQQRHPFYYYHVTQPSVVYSTAAKVKRYFLPHYWYEIYSTAPKSNLLFYGKLILTLLWLILAGTIVFKLFTK